MLYFGTVSYKTCTEIQRASKAISNFELVYLVTDLFYS